jgi:hypothetical protein
MLSENNAGTAFLPAAMEHPPQSHSESTLLADPDHAQRSCIEP